MRIENNGIGLYVEDVGSTTAPAVMFLHGVTSTAESYRWLPAEVLDGRRVIRLDLRGHGRSDRAPGTYTVAQYSEDVAVVIRQLVGRPVVLVGHSLGGCIAWTLAQQRPDLVRAALLEDPPLYFGEPEIFERSGTKLMFRLMRDAAAADQAQGKSEDEIAKRLRGMPLGPGKIMSDISTEDGIRAMAFGTRYLDPTVLDAAIDGSTLAAVNTTAPVTVPTQILAADVSQGGLFTPAHTTRLKATHPNVKVINVPGSGHIIHGSKDHQAVYLKHLLEFLKTYAPV